MGRQLDCYTVTINPKIKVRAPGQRSAVEPVARHDHPIDVDSGEVVEFRSDAIEPPQTEVAERLDFELTGRKLVLYELRTSRPDA